MENVEMKNKEGKTIVLLVGAIIFVIIVVGVILLLNGGKLGLVDKDNIEGILKERKSAIIYVENSDAKKCKNCSKIKEFLDEKKVNYILYDVNKVTEKDYHKMLSLLNITVSDFGYPAIIYIEDGSLYSNIINISDTEIVDRFIQDYHLTKVKS